MSNLIGVRAHDYGKDTPAGLLSRIAKDGWQTVQLAYPKAILGVKNLADVPESLLDETVQALRETGLTVAVLGAYIDPSLMNEERRRAQVALFLTALGQAKRLGAGCVGTETTNMKKQPFVSRADALRQLRRSLEEILPEAERLGVTVGVEPVHYHALNTPEAARGLLGDMASPRLKIIFDPVNLLRKQDIRTQHDLWQRCADSFGADIIALHLKGASRVSVAGVLGNAPLETSVVDYAALFAAIGRTGAPVLRELAVAAHAAADISFLSDLLK